MPLNKNKYLPVTVSKGQILRSGLAGQLWLGASHQLVVKMSAGLRLSEGLSGAKGFTSKVGHAW